MDEPAPKTAAPGTVNPALLKAAGAALLFSQIPWIWIVVEQFRMGAAPMAVFNALVTVAVLVTAAPLLRARPGGAGAALVESYYTAAFSAYWALRTESWPLWAGTAGAAATVLLILAWRNAQPRPAPREAAPPSVLDESFAPWIRENVEAIVIAFVMALVIRCFCIEVFKIPSSSMEPTLMGDAKDGSGRSGDRIMVTKYYFAASDIERFDVVVFKFPLNLPKNFIKRVVGLPNEEIKIVDGDLYTRKKAEEPFRVARKSLRLQDSLWIDPLGWSAPAPTLADPRTFEKHWEARPANAAYEVRDGALMTREKDGQRDARFEYHGLSDGSGQKVQDVHLAFAFEATGTGGGVFVEARNGHGTFEARLSTDGPGVFERRWTDKEGPRTKIIPLPGLKVVPDRRYRVDLSVFDGTALLRVDGAPAAEIVFIETEEDAALRDEGISPSVSFGARGLTFRVRDLAVGRDVCHRGKSYLPEGKALKTGPDEYVMMGDNVAFSHDSRAWTEWSYRIRGRAEPVRCESQETTDSSSDRGFIEKLAEKYGLRTEPDVGIKADVNGNEWALYREDPGNLPAGAPVGIIESKEDRHFPFVHRKHIVGKGLWVWWPRGRWFRLIR
jgi:signal peptidase I